MPAQPGSALLLDAGAQPAAAQPGAALVLASTLPAPTRLGGQTAAHWPRAVSGQHAHRVPWPAARGADLHDHAPWAAAAPRDGRAAATWPAAAQRDAAVRAPWGEYARHQSAHRSPWPGPAHRDGTARAPWGEFAAHQSPHRAPWPGTRTADAQAATPWGEYARHQSSPRVVWGRPVPLDVAFRAPWGVFLRHPGGGVVVVTPPTVDEHGTVVVPALRSYVTVNETLLHTVGSGIEIPAFGLNLAIDWASWCWTFDASLPASALALVDGTAGSPVELRALVNGTPFRLLAEQVSRDRTFGSARIRVTGRCHAAVLDAPFTATVALYSAAAITAQQAAIHAVTLDGLPLGWEIDWQLTDWLLPAGLWAHQGTPISAVTRIAQAAGGYVQADPDLKTLAVLPAYPVAPWDWPTATPDVVLPVNVVTREGIARQDRPAFNEIHVLGQAGGVHARVIRAGTTGGTIAPQVVDDLVTHAAAARQRGMRALADTGRQARVTLTMPVLDDTGILRPGTLIRYTDGATARTGIVRATRVQTGRPVTRQTLEVETRE